MPPPRFRGIFVILGIALIFCAMAVIFFVALKKRDRLEVCRMNLHYLWMETGTASPADEQRWDDVPTGGAFWTGYLKWPSRTVRPIRQSHLLCPVLAPVKYRTGTDYRGPAKSYRLLDAGDPVGADAPGNHGAAEGGTVVLKSGALFVVKPADPLWARAAETTSR